MNIPFHLVAVSTLAIALAHVRRHRSPRAVLTAAGGYSFVGMAAALLTQHGFFDLPGLGAWGIFLYGTLFAAGVAALLASSGTASVRVTGWVATVVGFGLVAIAFDAFVIEPHALELRHVRLTTERLSQPLRIALVAD